MYICWLIKRRKCYGISPCLGKVLLASGFWGCIVILQSSIKNSLLIALRAYWGKHEFSKEQYFQIH